MQDFTNFIADSNNLPTQEKQDKWLTKDRLWNFIFWFGMSLGLGIAFAIAFEAEQNNKFSYWAAFFFWLTIIGVPLVLKKINGTKFIKALTFANSEGQILTEEQRPYLFGYAIFAGLPNAFAIAETILCKAPENFVTGFILFLSFFAPISIYFIYKNCPISILFNYKFWTVEGNPNIALLKKVAKIIKED